MSQAQNLDLLTFFIFPLLAFGPHLAVVSSYFGLVGDEAEATPGSAREPELTFEESEKVGGEVRRGAK